MGAEATHPQGGLSGKWEGLEEEERSPNLPVTLDGFHSGILRFWSNLDSPLFWRWNPSRQCCSTFSTPQSRIPLRPQFPPYPKTHPSRSRCVGANTLESIQRGEERSRGRLLSTRSHSRAGPGASFQLGTDPMLQNKNRGRRSENPERYRQTTAPIPAGTDPPQTAVPA